MHRKYYENGVLFYIYIETEQFSMQLSFRENWI